MAECRKPSPTACVTESKAKKTICECDGCPSSSKRRPRNTKDCKVAKDKGTCASKNKPANLKISGGDSDFIVPRPGSSLPPDCALEIKASANKCQPPELNVSEGATKAISPRPNSSLFAVGPLPTEQEEKFEFSKKARRRHHNHHRPNCNHTQLGPGTVLIILFTLGGILLIHTSLPDDIDRHLPALSFVLTAASLMSLAMVNYRILKRSKSSLGNGTYIILFVGMFMCCLVVLAGVRVVARSRKKSSPFWARHLWSMGITTAFLAMFCWYKCCHKDKMPSSRSGLKSFQK